MATPLLAFVAENVAVDTVEYTPDFIVHMIAFGIGNPEADGHCWIFSRTLDDDDGVCTVRGIQRATIYEGIATFRLQRTGVVCVFDPHWAAEVGVTELRITFEIDDDSWNDLAAKAQTVFRDRPYFECNG
jgi:hypothetical protein